MAIIRIATSDNVYDITSTVLVLSSTPSQTEDKRCQIYVELGDGTNDLNGTGGEFELTLKIGAHFIQPAPQPYEFGVSLQAAAKTNQFIVPPGKAVKVFVKSPNAADVNVAVKAYLFEIPDFAELIIDPTELQAIITTAMSGLTVPNERVVLGPCEQGETATPNGRIVLGPCEQEGAISITRRNGVISVTR